MNLRDEQHTRPIVTSSPALDRIKELDLLIIDSIKEMKELKKQIVIKPRTFYNTRASTYSQRKEQSIHLIYILDIYTRDNIRWANVMNKSHNKYICVTEHRYDDIQKQIIDELEEETNINRILGRLNG